MTRVRVASGVVLTVVGVCIVGPWLLPDPLAIDPANTYAAPSAAHLFGTDEVGRDVFARLLVGGRVSLSVAFFAAVMATGIGGLLGVMAGYFGGWFDAILMRIVEGAIAIPKLPLLLILSAVAIDGDVGRLVLIMACFGWMTSARLARASAKQLRDSPHVVAARALGATDAYLLTRHVIPGVLSTVALAATLDLGEFIVYESVLSFLGLGVRPPAPSWGAMLSSGLTDLHTAPHLFLLPGIFTMVTIAALLWMGEGIAVDRGRRV